MDEDVEGRDWGRIFCLEGEWGPRQNLSDQLSVLPVLQILQAANEATYVHRRVGTKDQLRHYLRRWIKEDLPYYTLYLGFHGSEGELSVGIGETMTLQELGDELVELCEEFDQSLYDCVIYLGSCSVMLAEDDIDALLERTEAGAVIGYLEDVDWVDSAAVDLMALGHLSGYERLGDALNKLESEQYESLSKEPIGFRVQRHPRRQKTE